MSHINLQSIVSKQIPEFIRSDYPAFVEFMQAYYEWLNNQKINLADVRDIDETVDNFVQYFKSELDIFGGEYQFIDERLFLRKSKQLFTAKGAESSFKLLFKILYNKSANITYPWDQVLKPSDGKWQQDISLFIKLDSGLIDDIIGNYVSIKSPDRSVNIPVFVTYTRAIEDVKTHIAGTFIPGREYTILDVGTTDFTAIGADSNNSGVKFTATNVGTGTGSAYYSEFVYEIFIDKDYRGKIELDYSLELIQEVVTFDAIRNVNVANNSIVAFSHGFQTGDNVVYSYQGGLGVAGLGTTSSYYVIRIDDDSFKLAISRSDALKGKSVTISGPGIGSSHTFTKSVRGTILPTASSYKVIKPGSGYKVGQLITGATQSAGKVITSLLKVTRVDSNGGIVSVDTIRYGYNYAQNFFVLTPSPNKIVPGTAASLAVSKNGIEEYSLSNDSIIEKYSDYGYILNPAYMDISYTDIDYAAILLQQFYQEIASNLGDNVDFSIISFNIGPVAKYPGHFVSNDGFLDDDIYIQDSYRYQKYSYVVSVNEGLENYKAIVKAYLHPAGTALFGEYRIEYDNVLNISHEQVLSKWTSKATFSTINTSIRTDYVFPEDAGGWLRTDPYDLEQYAEASSEVYNPPVTIKFFGDGRNILEDVNITISDTAPITTVT